MLIIHRSNKQILLCGCVYFFWCIATAPKRRSVSSTAFIEGIISRQCNYAALSVQGCCTSLVRSFFGLQAIFKVTKTTLPKRQKQSKRPNERFGVAACRTDERARCGLAVATKVGAACQFRSEAFGTVRGGDIDCGLHLWFLLVAHAGIGYRHAVVKGCRNGGILGYAECRGDEDAGQLSLRIAGIEDILPCP